MPEKFAQMAEAVYNMEVREDDVWIVTYPKCGTTWMQVPLMKLVHVAYCTKECKNICQELLWQVINGVQLDLDKYPSRLERHPFLEASCLVPGKLYPPDEELPKQMVDHFEDRYRNPRFKKCQLKYTLLFLT